MMTRLEPDEMGSLCRTEGCCAGKKNECINTSVSVYYECLQTDTVVDIHIDINIDHYSLCQLSQAHFLKCTSIRK